MKTILTTIAVLALAFTFTSCKKNTIAPATQPASSNAKQDSLYRNIAFEVQGDSMELWINNTLFKKNTIILAHDTMHDYNGTQLFYKGDVVTIKASKTTHYTNSLYTNGYGGIWVRQYYAHPYPSNMFIGSDVLQQISGNPVTVLTFTVK